MSFEKKVLGHGPFFPGNAVKGRFFLKEETSFLNLEIRANV
jgi:hypothetical protein